MAEVADDLDQSRITTNNNNISFMSRLTGQRTQLYYEQALNQSFRSISISLSFYLGVVNTSNLGYLFHNRTVPPPLNQRVDNKQTQLYLSVHHSLASIHSILSILSFTSMSYSLQ
jgi:hypothetical protein